MSLDPVTAGIDLVNTAISRIWPDKTVEQQQQLAAAVMAVQGQLDINKAEATNPSVFVSGWRPFIGWVCGGACAWNWVGISIVNTICLALQHPLQLSSANLTEMMPILLGMLGLGGLRTIEKINNVAAK